MQGEIEDAFKIDIFGFFIKSLQFFKNHMPDVEFEMEMKWTNREYDEREHEEEEHHHDKHHQKEKHQKNKDHHKKHHHH